MPLTEEQEKTVMDFQTKKLVVFFWLFDLLVGFGWLGLGMLDQIMPVRLSTIF